MSNERFVIVIDGGDVSVLDTGHDLVEEEGNAELFNIDFVDTYDAKYVARELDTMVREMNWMHKELQELRGK